MNAFHRALIAGFLAGTAGLTFAVNETMSRLQPEAVRAARIPPRTPLDPALFDASVERAEDAKARGLFWLSNEPGVGAAVRLLDAPAVFDEAFPGYEAARDDRALWSRYFRQTFDLALRSARLSSLGDTMMLNASWVGNFELFKHHGADLLVFGASELFMNASPGLLRDGLVGPENRDYRILFCGTGSMMPETVRRSAEAMGPSGRKAAAAVWGYSLWNAYKFPFVMGRQREKWTRLELWTLEQRYGAAIGGAAHAALHFGWDAFLDLRARDALWKRFIVRPSASVSQGAPAARRVAGLDVLPGSEDTGWLFPESVRHDESKLAALAAATTPYYYGFIGVGEKDCDMTAASAELDETLAALHKVAERVVLVIPPTTPLLTDAAPPCFAPAVRAMLASKAGPRVAVVLDDWKDYGLGYADFVWPTAKPGYVQFNFNHVNFAGTRKLTARLAARLRAALGRSAR